MRGGALVRWPIVAFAGLQSPGVQGQVVGIEAEDTPVLLTGSGPPGPGCQRTVSDDAQWMHDGMCKMTDGGAIDRSRDASW